jgi:Predicted xylanase/chitin deacetylase
MNDIVAAPRRVALTFDAEHPDRQSCPPGNIERILDTLKAAEVRATFFVQGRWAQAQPSAAKRIADDGHLVGHHSFYHARMPLLSDAGIREDVAEAEQCIKEITGVDPRPWFRCPFGAGEDDPRVLQVLGELGYRNVGWHVAVEDWEPWRLALALITDAVEGVRTHGDGAVVLLHSWPGGTGDALEQMITDLRVLGAEFTAVDELEILP